MKSRVYSKRVSPRSIKIKNTSTNLRLQFTFREEFENKIDRHLDSFAPSIADIYRDANDSISLAKGVERRSPFNNLTRGDLLENDSRHVHIYTHTVRKVEEHGDKKRGTGKKVRSCTR